MPAGGPVSAVELQPDHVRSLWRVLGVRFGFAVASKRDDRIARAVGAWLAQAGVVAADDWLARFATYLPLPRELGGPTVFMPFEPGEDSAQWPLESQALVAIHEAHHAHQYLVDPLGFLARYIASSADRANYEREARAAAECVRLALWGEVADPVVSMASLVTSYGCHLADVAVATEDLRLDEVTIRGGGITSPVAAMAIDWWRRHEMQSAIDVRGVRDDSLR